MKNLPKNVVLGVFVLLAFCLGWVSHTSIAGKSEQVREDSNKYKYINSLLYVDNSSTVFKELNPLKDQVDKYINDQVREGKADRVSFYYRDLNSSKWTGVDPDEKFIPGSILKVATMMVYLDLSEDNPDILSQKLYYRKDPTEHQNYPPSVELPDGYYTVSELIDHSIIESDNAAALALSIPRLKEIEQFYKTLRLTLPPTQVADFMSARDISKIFRTLYSSTYLVESYSDQVLKFLTQTKFDKGLVAGVDNSVEVAHKFGEYSVYYPNNEKPPEYQLHDCGIVYVPSKPYFICVMTQGKNLSNLENVLADVSRMTYQFAK